ncbi:MAG: nucleotidyltransferase family protein [Chloroflexi bacterium]|nr:nucleotidyltransferase family protein [Chloroflexota bacterium]
MKRSVRTKERVLSLIAAQQPTLRALGVQRLGLFGSFVRGEPRPDSDVDFLVEFAPGQKNFDNLMQLGFLLEDLLRRRVELVTPESISPYLRPHILGEVEYVTIAP